MKIAGRTLIILAAALAVCGATFALVNSGRGGFGNRGEFVEGQRGPRAEGQQAPSNGTTQQGQPPFRPERGRGEGGRGGGFSLFAAAGMLRDLAIVGVVVLIVASIAGWLRRRKILASDEAEAVPPA